MEKNSQVHDIDMYIDEFKKNKLKQVHFTYAVCNRTLYKKSVITLQKNKYPRQDCFMLQCSFDGKEYVCKTCHGKLLKGQQPCQSVVNNLFVDETPTALAALEKLEQILIAQRIVFEKIVVMPKGQQRKIKGAICNVPVECSQMCNVLPRPPDRSGIILLKLKRKLQFRGHVYFQAVRPEFVINALNWLIANNPLYRNIEIQCDNINPELTNLNCPDTDQEDIDRPFQLQSNFTREVSAQECVYRCMPELWLRKILPKTLFVSTDFAENRVRFAKKQQELDELDDDSTDIFKSNIIVRYSDRLKNMPVVNDMCLALFAAHYFKDYKIDFNEVSDSQPEVLSDDFIESQNIENHNTGLPDRIKLVNSKEIMKCRKIKAVIRYHTPNKRKEPEKYFHHLLMLYFSWRNEQELFGEDQTYISKFYEPEVQEVVQRNKEIFEPDGDGINEALENLRNFGVPTHCYDPINDQENEDL